MRNFGLAYWGSFITLVGLALAVSTYNVDTSEVFAETDTETITINCAAGLVTVFAPDIAFTLTSSAGATSSPTGYAGNLNSQISTTSSLSNMVNADVAGEDLNIIEPEIAWAGAYIMTYDAPNAKVAGMLCNGASQGSAKLRIRVSTNSIDIDTLVLTMADVDKIMVTDLEAADSDIQDVFGTGANAISAAIQDTAAGLVGDGAQNGEVLFGHDSTAGDFRLGHTINVLGLGAAGASEVLTYTATPGS